MVPKASQNTQSVVHWNGEEVEFVANSLGWEDPLEEGSATPFGISVPGESHGQRSLAGCSP